MTRPWQTTGERGSVSLFAVACLALLLLLGSALGVVAAMVRAHRVAQSAADLTALAVASVASPASRGRDPCAVGAGIAEANGAVMTACRRVGSDAIVTVEVRGPRWLGQVSDLSAEARAGPG